MHRRTFLQQSGLGLGSIALGSLMAKTKSDSLPHFAPTAKHVIYLFQSGGPSHMDLFDYKPILRTLHGKQLPDSIRKGQRLTGMTARQK